MDTAVAKTQMTRNLMKTTLITTAIRMGIGSRGMCGLRLGDEDEDMMNRILRIRICLKPR